MAKIDGPLEELRERKTLDNLIGPECISMDLFVAVLDDAGIDHELPKGDSVYITGGAFPIWLKLNGADQSVMVKSWCPFVSGIDELDALRFVNRHNTRQVTVQFALSENSQEFWGYYWLSWHDGLLRRQLLRAILRFAKGFYRAMSEGMGDRLLEDPTVEGSFAPEMLN